CFGLTEFLALKKQENVLFLTVCGISYVVECVIELLKKFGRQIDVVDGQVSASLIVIAASSGLLGLSYFLLFFLPVVMSRPACRLLLLLPLR
ncbi:hypothetical protein, partial [Brevibacillus sp. SIMBA_040]|uniref:hypothetical protein n=1 Tax=Brevibacillus sp. SIMBA_040 TaxID=3085781 RepID=UPI003978DDFF